MNPAIPVRFFRNGQTLSAAFADDVPGLECYNLPAAADAGKIVIEFALPVAGVTGYWYGSLQPGVKMQLDWDISFVTGAQYNSPVFALVGRDCRCRAAVTLSDLMDDARFEAKLLAEAGLRPNFDPCPECGPDAAPRRAARFHLAERKAARAPSLMIFPMALFIMPTVFIIIITPVREDFLSDSLTARVKAVRLVSPVRPSVSRARSSSL